MRLPALFRVAIFFADGYSITLFDASSLTARLVLDPFTEKCT